MLENPGHVAAMYTVFMGYRNKFIMLAIGKLWRNLSKVLFTGGGGGGGGFAQRQKPN